MVKNMKRNRVISAILCLLTLLPAMALPVRAANDKTITLTYCVEGENNAKVPMADVTFTIYRVGTMDANGVITPDKAFEVYVPASADSTAVVWRDAAQKLDEDLSAKKLTAVQPAATAKTDDSGIARFENLTPGLYFIQSTKVLRGGMIYETMPVFVSTFSPEITAKYSQIPEYMDIKVIKVWEDSCHPSRRPKSITVRLMCDGSQYDVITLPHNGKWEYTWTNLETKYNWTVEEDSITGYKNPKIRYSNGIFTITNTCNRPGAHSNKELTQTGQLWWPVPVLFAAGLVLVIVGLIRRREDSYED